MSTLFTQTTIAMVWDFDKTLIPGYMQRPLFEKYQVDESKFWKEVNQLTLDYKRRGCEQVSTEIPYLNHILHYVRDGRFKGLDNNVLFELGKELEFYSGLPELFKLFQQKILDNPDYQKHGISVEHYVVSTGLTRMIKGSAIADYIDGIWGCEFLEDETSGELAYLGYVLDNTTKTRAIFEINKGTNKLEQIDVNSHIEPADRRIPFENMVYTADGPSDVPVFSVVNRNGGKTYGVYKAGEEKEFAQANRLLNEKRVQSFGEANYTEGSQTWMWLWNAVSDIADNIIRKREQALGNKVGQAPKHLND